MYQGPQPHWGGQVRGHPFNTRQERGAAVQPQAGTELGQGRQHMGISFLLLCNEPSQSSWLKQHIYYLTASARQDSECHLAGFSAQGLMGQQSSCELGCTPIWRLDRGRICFQAHSGC